MGRGDEGRIKESHRAKGGSDDPVPGQGCCSPGSILSAAVHVRAVLEEMPHDAQPASGTGLVQGTVTRVVTMIHITRLVFQTIQNHFLETGGKTDEHRVISCRVNGADFSA